ncbi:MAG TPA: hypothetical protein VFH51_18720 [Myxococcota bacterium]|nr:hypothetical protein [Myxococcota bacterium]
MPSELPRPPRRASPAQLLEQFLPALWQALNAEAGIPWPEGSATVEVHVDAAVFHLTFDAKGLHAAAGAAPAPLATVRCDLDAYHVTSQDILPRVIAFTEAQLRRAHRALHEVARHPDLARLAELLAPHAGRLNLVYTDDAGDVSTCEVDIGTGSGPVATVQLSDTDLDALLQGGKAGLVKLLRGRIRITGDASYVLKLAALVKG